MDLTGTFFAEATAFILTGPNLHYLIGWLNSPTIGMIFKNFYAGGGLGEEGYRYKKAFLEKLPIPEPNKFTDSDVNQDTIISYFGFNTEEIAFLSS